MSCFFFSFLFRGLVLGLCLGVFLVVSGAFAVCLLGFLWVSLAVVLAALLSFGFLAFYTINRFKKIRIKHSLN